MGRSRVVVTATEEVWLARDPEAVFDYTQDYSKRPEWDAGITEAAIVADAPRTVRVKVPGLGSMSVVYRLDRRPERTSAAFEDVDSQWITGGGGSWQYESVAGGTQWRQTNTLELRSGLLSRLLAPLIRRNLRRSMRRAMAEAKRRLEAD